MEHCFVIIQPFRTLLTVVVNTHARSLEEELSLVNDAGDDELDQAVDLFDRRFPGSVVNKYCIYLITYVVKKFSKVWENKRRYLDLDLIQTFFIDANQTLATKWSKFSVIRIIRLHCLILHEQSKLRMQFL